jgi:hypothetical protein
LPKAVLPRDRVAWRGDHCGLQPLSEPRRAWREALAGAMTAARDDGTPEARSENVSGAAEIA